MTETQRELRRLIAAELNETPGGTYHRAAPPDAAYPYKVYGLERVSIGERGRQDYSLVVDVWDRSGDTKHAEHITDMVTQKLQEELLPQDKILPYFYFDNSFPVPDSDRELTHYQLHFLVQTYLKED